MKYFQFERRFEDIETDWGTYIVKFTDTVVNEQGKVIYSNSEDFEVLDEWQVAEVKVILKQNFDQMKQFIEQHPDMLIVPEGKQ